MSAPLALQMYTVRDLLTDDFEGVVRKVAEFGYAGVEWFGSKAATPEDAKKLFDELGLTVASTGTAVPVGDDKDSALEHVGIMGCSHFMCGKGPDDFETADKVKATCEVFNEANENAKAAGLTMCIHNHWWEYSELDGVPVYNLMLQHLDPSVQFEIDVYWVQTGGCDPVSVIGEIGDRAPLLHIKDGPCVKEENMTAVGEGKVDIAGVVQAAEGKAKWHIVELDRCDTDMLEAVGKSAEYMIGNGYSTGKE
jgi:sugar phosphate isomerase/epimerase